MRIFTNPSLPSLYTVADILGKADILAAAAAILVLLIVDIAGEKTDVRDLLAKQNILLRWTVIFAVLFAVIFMGIYGPGYSASSFIYEQF